VRLERLVLLVPQAPQVRLDLQAQLAQLALQEQLV
jgi:hypothetical protein